MLIFHAVQSVDRLAGMMHNSGSSTLPKRPVITPVESGVAGMMHPLSPAVPPPFTATVFELTWDPWDPRRVRLRGSWGIRRLRVQRLAIVALAALRHAAFI